MKKFMLAALITFGLASIGHAQASAGSTGRCKDGTYTSAKSKRGACSGHGGVGTWMADSAAPAAPAAQPAPAAKAVKPAPTPITQPSAPAQATTQAAPAQGGGPGMVWVNLPTKIYHCPGTRYYGTTKSGKYMSEADAKAMGARGDHNKTCSN